MQNNVNKPVFVVGSPRSGTSILTWCFSEHPNLFGIPESSWMGQFAINLAISYEIGAARSNRSVLSAMNMSRDEFFSILGRSINELILGHRKELEKKRYIPSSPSVPKRRWVDGTPEYSFYMYGLRKLFPDAVFIHILRNVRDVVRSMLNFYRVAGTQLVANEQEAYTYWLRTVRACVQAEQAYGPRVVYRLPYQALVDNAESAMRSLLDFLVEPYCAKCLAFLTKRIINSSNVPEDFVAEDPATDPSVVKDATELWEELKKTPQAGEPSSIAADEMEAAFQERVNYFATLDNAYQKTQQMLEACNKHTAPSELP
jgi:hypothetical protein